jgi:hypothetical protein
MSGSSSLRGGGGGGGVTRRRKESSTSDQLGDLDSAGMKTHDKMRENNSTFDFEIGDVNSSSN